MDDKGNVELYEDLAIKKKVLEVWAEVFSVSNRVIVQADSFGFLGMELIPVPNIHQMMVILQSLSSIIDILVNSAEGLDVEYDEIRLLLNAKEQITRMERVAAALKANNRNDFELAMSQLGVQAVF